MNNLPTRVYIVDDDRDLSGNLVKLLEQARYQVRTFESGESFREAYPTLPAGCILTDLIMPGMNGLDLQRWLVENGCRWPMIILTGHGDPDNAAHAVAAGAVAFLEKPVRRVELYAAMLKAEAYLAGATDTIPDPELAHRTSKLTPRERDALSGVLDKKSNKEIAAELGISESSVKSYRRQARQKIGARNTAELVMLALRAGFTGRRES